MKTFRDLLLGIWIGACLGTGVTYHVVMESGRRAGVVQVERIGFKPGWAYRWTGDRRDRN